MVFLAAGSGWKEFGCVGWIGGGVARGAFAGSGKSKARFVR